MAGANGHKMVTAMPDPHVLIVGAGPTGLMLAREPNNWYTHIADSKGREARKRAPFQIRICCRRSQHLLCYADQPIPWSNCS